MLSDDLVTQMFVSWRALYAPAQFRFVNVRSFAVKGPRSVIDKFLASEQQRIVSHVFDNESGATKEARLDRAKFYVWGGIFGLVAFIVILLLEPKLVFLAVALKIVHWAYYKTLSLTYHCIREEELFLDLEAQARRKIKE